MWRPGLQGGTDSHWLYPSAQMFYNALVRKGKANDVREEDMKSVVSVHNSMNELTWKSVLQWERLHREYCPYPMLLRFEGRPHDLSPRARWLGMWGKEAPFDRHDWCALAAGAACAPAPRRRPGQQQQQQPQQPMHFAPPRAGTCCGAGRRCGT